MQKKDGVVFGIFSKPPPVNRSMSASVENAATTSGDDCCDDCDCRCECDCDCDCSDCADCQCPDCKCDCDCDCCSDDVGLESTILMSVPMIFNQLNTMSNQALQAKLNALNQAIEQDQNNNKLLIERSIIHVAMHSYKKALADYNAVLIRNPNNFSIIFQQAELYKIMNKFEEAKQCYDTLLGMTPDNAWAKKGQIDLLLLQDKYDEGLNICGNLFEKNPTDIWTLEKMVELHTQLGQTEKAENIKEILASVLTSETSHNIQ